MKKLVGVIFEEKPDADDGCLLQLLVAAVIVAVIVWLGAVAWGKFSDWRKGPDAVRNEKIEEIERKKKEVAQSLRDEADPFSKGPSDSAKRDAAKKLAELENEKRSLLKEQEQAAKSPATSSNANDAKRAVTEPQILKTLEGVPLPRTVVVTESLNLLNERGKETAIPVGSIIKIEKRGEKGSLTCQIDGALFVGNELRFFGKVKMR